MCPRATHPQNQNVYCDTSVLQKRFAVVTKVFVVVPTNVEIDLPNETFQSEHFQIIFADRVFGSQGAN